MNQAKTLNIMPLICCLVLSGCAANADKTYSVATSRLASGMDYQQALSDEDRSVANTAEPASGFQKLSSLRVSEPVLRSQAEAARGLNEEDQLSFAAQDMPAEEFVHAVFGKMLKLNYVIADGAKGLEDSVTLNLQQPVSSRRLYLLASQVLDSRGVNITYRDDTYFIHAKADAKSSSVALGIGRSYRDVPQVVGQVLQIVPIKYGMNISLERTLRELVTAKITPDFEKNMLFITAERSEILRALDLVELLDMPASRGRNVGILRLTYVSPEEFIDKASKLLLSEGIPTDNSQNPKSNVVMVPLEQIGAVAMFGSEPFYLDRVNYWAKQLDKPSEGTQRRYYVFHPRFARASDLGRSVAPLLGHSFNDDARAGNQSRDTASAFNNTGSKQAPGSSRQAGSGPLTVQNEKITMTVDERSNTLIFYTSGIEYQTLLPMIKRLDVMPKQILLEATIAEVTLTDALSMGVEFAIQNGNFGYKTKGAFGLDKIGGFSLSYLDAGKEFMAQLQASDTKVNILSNPSVVVRDGVSASINIGTDIPVVGSTSVNPGTETETTSVEYRKTGVKLNVTPTINAQGLVVLEIDQSISNTTEGSNQSGSPAIFERSIQTEVLAQSGQTVMLGGLISENTSNGQTKVPLFGDLPLIGAAFRSQKDSTTKTELILLITPKVIDQPEHWQNIRSKLDAGLQYLKLRD